MLRHGESVWNEENKFTGWTDVDLSPRGVEEARNAGRLLRSEGFSFDEAHTSVLKRAIRTLWIVLDELDLMWLPVFKTWRLNEKHYGALQGLNKAETAKRVGEEQVHAWRRRYDVRPPALEPGDERAPLKDPRYAGIPEEELPLTESLKDVEERLKPYWEELREKLLRGREVLVSAHGNSLRALVKVLEGLSPGEVERLNIPTGYPLVYELSPALKVLGKRYLGDPEEVKAAVNRVERQGKAGGQG